MLRRGGQAPEDQVGAIWLFGILANLPKIKKAGKHDIILFSRWTLSHDLVGDTAVGEKSFAAYIKDYFGKGAN